MYKKSLIFKIFSLFASLNLALQPVVSLIIVNQPLVFAQEEISEEESVAIEEVVIEEKEEKAAEENNQEDQEADNSQNEPSPVLEEMVTPTPVPTLDPQEAQEEDDPSAEEEVVINQEANLNPDQPEPEIEEIITPTPVPTPTPQQPPEEEPKKITKVCLEEEVELTKTVNGDWEINEEEGFAKTISPVQLGVTYIYPQEEKVTITFTCLPKDESLRSPLKIQKLKISDLNLPEDFNPYGEYAYDITTDMENGTFEYDITLPGPENQEVSVSYMEDIDGELKTVEEEKVNQEGDNVKVENLDHFTTFIVVKSLPTGINEGENCNITNTGTGLCYETIQKAIDAASDGDAIHISPGTYLENVIVNKQLTIIGAGSENDPNSNTIIIPNLASNPVLKIQSAGKSESERLVLKDMRIDGNKTSSDGIQISNIGSYITLNNVASIENSNRGVAANWNGVAQSIEIIDCVFNKNGGPGFRTSSSSSIKDLKIINTHMDENLNGLYLNAPITGLNITGGSLNKNHGPGTNGVGIWTQQLDRFDEEEKLPNILQNFTANENKRGVILHTYGPFSIINATISNNEEEGVAFATDGEAPGVTNGNISSPITFRNVTVENNPKWGLWAISYLGWTLSNLTIENSTFSGSQEEGSGYGVYLYAANESELSGVTVTESTILNNNVGIYLRSGYTGNLSNVILEKNSIKENNTGILISDKASKNTNSAQFNNITENANLGVQNNDLNSSFDATLNWWGSPSGPSGKASGSGDAISLNVDYQEWLCEPYETEWYSINGQCDESKKITICHATNSHQNPYVVHTPNKSGTLNGHVDHTGPVWYPGIEDHSWGDIIPPFTYYIGENEYQYDGLNWPEGQAIWENDCKIPPPPPEECGNGVVEGNEECDGEDGVTPGKNFCTANCKLVPIYNGDNKCPPGTERGQSPVASTTISSTDPDGEVLSLTSGKTYLFEASGQYEYWTGSNGNYMADAGYATRNNWGTLRDDLGIWPGAEKRGVLSLLSDMGTDNIGVVTWGDYNENHTYQKAYTIGDGDTDVNFLISDWYNEWYDDSPYNYNNQQAMRDNEGSLNLDIYECVAPVEVEICKEDDLSNRLPGWDVVLASKKVDGPTLINVSDSSGTNSSDLETGKYLLKVSGTYRYGNSQMIADAGYSYRPNNIPSGCDCWLSGLDLPSGNGLMVQVNNNTVYWGALNEPLHTYTHVYDHSGGPINFSISDNYYGDNLNNGGFQFEIYKIEDGHYGQTEQNGCVALSVVPGEYILDEVLQSDWINLDGKGDLVHVNDENNNFVIKNKIDAPVTIVAHKIVCNDESLLPNWGAVKSHGNPITADTAQNFIDNSQENCWFEEDWDFEWGPANSGYGGDSLIGSAGGEWSLFGPTDENGKKQIEINNLSGVGDRIEMREVLKEGYIPFTYATSGNNNSNDVSAEFYCHNDVMNYDNWEWINNPQYGQTYYCVAFNAPLYGSISGYKWEDFNGNGEWEEEPGLGDWTIELKQGGQVLKTETTSTKDGSYSFENILPGEYEVCEVLLEGWKQTYPNPANLEINNDTVCHLVVLEPGEEASNLNFGNLKLGYIQGRKYEDSNRDGSHQSGEPWLESWEINQYDDQWNYLSTTNTAGNNGIYRFENLDLGTYYTCEVLQDGWTQTGPTLGGNRVINESQNKEVEGEVCWQSVFNQSGQSRTGRQFGNIQYGTVEVYKFDDVNGDGLWDESEEDLLPDWEIILGEKTESTDNDGKALFTDLALGQYNLSEILKDGWEQTGIYCLNDNNQEENNNNDIEQPTPTPTPYPETAGILGLVSPVFAVVQNNSNSFHQVAVNPGQTTTCYIGNFELGSISGYKIYDRNDNGVREEGEEGIGGWEICLTGDPLESENCRLTNEEGYYEFTGLTAGVYTVSEKDRSADGWRASNPENGQSDPIIISSGTNAQADFYNAPPASILLIKNNNATGSVGIGQTIEYTLTITVGQRTLSEMELIDVLPDGLVYQPGTSTIDGVGVEPTITNNGKTLTWNWDKEVPGESVVVIKYTIQISSANEAATYTNIAYVYGYGSPTLVESSIVDSSVVIEPKYKVEGRTAGGQVLGVAAEGEVLGVALPATGANTWYTIVALVLIGAGITLRVKSKKFEDN